MRTKGDGTNENSLEFPNRSRIIGLPGSEETIRGFSSVSLLLVDEAARVPDDLYMAVRPMVVVSGGGLWLMSTPNGKRGFFWEAWERGEPEWEKVAVTGYDCPRIGREALEEDRRTMGERKFRQEYMCEFGDTEGGMFERDLMDRAVSSEFEQLQF
jgi:phage FluMu gp28-like protein